MNDGFTQKEMLLRMMSQLEKIENKLNETHEKACVTNGKVKLHTKLIFGLSGSIIVLGGWIITSILK